MNLLLCTVALVHHDLWIEVGGLRRLPQGDPVPARRGEVPILWGHEGSALLCIPGLALIVQKPLFLILSSLDELHVLVGLLEDPGSLRVVYVARLSHLVQVLELLLRQDFLAHACELLLVRTDLASARNVPGWNLHRGPLSNILLALLGHDQVAWH